ncbi:acylneuraminate cytidylyltransferase family protein [Paenibacillus thiaminolyticus]|uniref:acylneuraminate cytidylyltransferase family protein n=1 Tax=Paenibacillus thiaminolyticus TaxID=49283 RepID=UPI00234FD9ED|nr:acylneuraminate cytidylyltransferase family protein [Paenibacillus thiaminolyticus]WCR26233.1 acylneuraminate cytidylyltransferase family protein [Paenibacillus thiaminolyticus]
MIREAKTLAIIPARGGSKGLPRKNVKPLIDKPLIAWTIEQALQSRYIDRVIVSTEDEEIAEVSRKFGAEVPFLRPSELAGDESSVIESVMYVLERITDYENVVLLQPTSPLRVSEDIDNCLEWLMNNEVDSVVSVTSPEKSPYWCYRVDEHSRLLPLFSIENNLPRQQLPQAFVLNGAVYAMKVEHLVRRKGFVTEHTLGYKMPIERSIDIDSELDFWLCEKLLEEKR